MAAFLAWTLVVALAAHRAAAAKPHVLLVLADDLGYGNVGWTRAANNCSTPEVQTPRLDELVREGIELTRFYAYHMCSPSRSSLLSGRLPIHVNVVNADPTIYNASESSGTGAGIPRNMTGLASKMKEGGYRTHMVGKVGTALSSLCQPAQRQYAQACRHGQAGRRALTGWLAARFTVGRGHGNPNTHAEWTRVRHSTVLLSPRQQLLGATDRRHDLPRRC
jgi:arylsulfatase A-like enzyme